jgi:hypothetical protein
MVQRAVKEDLTDTSAPAEAAPPPPTPAEVLAALEALPITLNFPHRTISPQSKTIHGSVTLADVAKRLEDEFSVPSTSIDVFWRIEDDQARMKELSRWELEIAPKGGEKSVLIGVEVTRME